MTDRDFFRQFVGKNRAFFLELFYFESIFLISIRLKINFFYFFEDTFIIQMHVFDRLLSELMDLSNGKI